MAQASMPAGERDPFERGPEPVGVRSVEWHDAARRRSLSVEIYYPAQRRHAGQDLDPRFQDRFSQPGSMAGDGIARPQAAVRDAAMAEGAGPVVIFSHGYSGDRREFSGLCTHLASHGYRVLSADHAGSTFADVQTHMARPDFDRRATVWQMGQDRLGDVPFLLDMAEKEFRSAICDAGITGVSMGGWTSLIAPSADARIKATAPLVPGGGDGPLAFGGNNALKDLLPRPWLRAASVLMIVGDRDAWLPLYGQLASFEQCLTPDKRLVIMKKADHQHFVDDMQVCHEWYRKFTLELAANDAGGATPWAAVAAMIRPWEELMSEAEAQRIVFGLVTRHMDEQLVGPPRTASYSSSLGEELRRRGLGAYVCQFE